MQVFELDYEDAGETQVTGVPASSLHDLRVVLVTTDPVLERRVRQHLEIRGARVEVVADWGRASLYRVQGVDPQLILLDPATDLRSRADASRRLGDDTRLRWAMLDRVPRNIETSEGVDRLMELASVALGADRQLQAEVLLHGGAELRAPVDTIGPARLLWVLGTGGGAHRVTFEDEGVRGLLDVADGFIVQARWVEIGREREALTGLPAVTALSALRTGEMKIVALETETDAHVDDVGLADDVLFRSARPELSWVATRVATGRYLYPPPVVRGPRSEDPPIADRDLPEATKRARPSALTGEKPTIEVPVVEAASLAVSANEPEADLSMPRMPRVTGPKAPVDTIFHKPDPSAVKVQTIVRLETHADPEIEIEVESDAPAEDEGRTSYDILPATQPPVFAFESPPFASASESAYASPFASAPASASESASASAFASESASASASASAAPPRHAPGVYRHVATGWAPPKQPIVFAPLAPSAATPIVATRTVATPAVAAPTGPTKIGPSASAAPVTAAASTPAPVAAVDTIRPAAPARRRRVAPILVAAIVVLGLGAAGAGTYAYGTDRLASFASGALEALPLDALPLDELPFADAPTPSASAPAASLDLDDTAHPAHASLAPSEVVAPDANANANANTNADPNANADTNADTMVFALDEEETDTAGEPRSPDTHRRARRRARRAALAEVADGSDHAEEARDAAPADAVARYTRALSRNANDARAMKGLAEAHLALGNAAEAVHWADRATTARPSDAASWVLFGRALRAAGDPVSAEHAFTRARALSPSADAHDSAADAPDASDDTSDDASNNASNNTSDDTSPDARDLSSADSQTDHTTGAARTDDAARGARTPRPEATTPAPAASPASPLAPLPSRPAAGSLPPAI